MDPIIWSYEIKDNQCPTENIKRFLKFSSFDSLEFTTTESLMDLPGHKYNIHSLSMVGDPAAVNINMAEITNKIKSWVLNYVDSDESYATKVYELKHVVFLLNEFMIHHQPYNVFYTSLKNTFTIISLTDENNAEVTIQQLNFTEANRLEIQKHLMIRYNYCYAIKEFCLLALDKLHLSDRYIDSTETPKDIVKELQLLEVWLSFEKLGFLDYETNHLKKAELRNSFMNIFNCNDDNYKKNRSALINKKNRSADFLKSMIEAFEN